MFRRITSASGVLLFAGFAILLCWAAQAWIIGIGRDRDQFEPVVRASKRVVPATQRCSACHAGVHQNMATSPHRRTLNEGADPEIRSRFAGRSFQHTLGGPTVSFEERDQQLWMKSDAYPDAIRVDWMFGSGQHAMTPVSLLVNTAGATELIEGSVSWFPPGVLGATPGANLSGTPGISSLGSPQDHPTTLECFGCHVTQLPVQNGRILTDEMFRGVTCERCHFGGEQHARAMELGSSYSWQKWSDLTPLESVNRCGECHRRADQLTPDELLPERTVLVRFASVGLAMSRCFLDQDTVHDPANKTRLDCLTCHDPHRPAERSSASYVQKCLQCHGLEASQARECTSSQTASNCLSCHMPSVSVADNLVLTDHWIRVRKDSDPPVAVSEDQ